MKLWVSFCHKRVSRGIWKRIYLFTRKYWKIVNLYSSKQKVARIDKNGEEIKINICYLWQFIDNARFMATSSSNLVNNFSEGINRVKRKYRHHDKKCETYGMKYKMVL